MYFDFNRWNPVRNGQEKELEINAKNREQMLRKMI